MDKPQKKSAPISRRWLVLIIITAVMALLNIISWLSVPTADLFMKAFSAVSPVFSSIAGIFPFSVGEILIGAGILLLIAVIPLFLVLGIKNKHRAMKNWAFFYCAVLVFILSTETLACYMYYHTTEFSAKYHHSAGADGFTNQQLEQLTEEIIAEANSLAEIVNRDEQGDIILPDDTYEQCGEALNRLSADYPELKGSYPHAKQLSSSMLMTQLDLQGVYFPFTLEANYNGELAPSRQPCTIAHELSHLKGFIREDEACFIAYRACLLSDSPEIRYSGYISALNYLLNAVKNHDSREELTRLCGLVTDRVKLDNYFVSYEYKKKVEEKAVIPTETVSAVSEAAIDTTLKLNGITDGKQSYSRMVDLLLEYRFCIMEE